MHISTFLSENVWISASAGSGKTKALIDKFLKILLSGTAPTKILCVTFTKAAAAEMFKRITEELTIWAVCDEANLVERITALIGSAPKPNMINLARNCFEKFVEAVGEVHISTIHAFCKKLVEQFPQECHLEPGYKLADEQLIKTLVEDAKISFLNDDAIFSDESIQYLFADLNETKLDKLFDKILHIHHLSPNFFNNRKKLFRYVEVLREELKLSENYSQERELKNLIANVRAKIKEASITVLPVTEWLSATITMSDKDILLYLNNIFLTKKNTPKVSVLKKNEITPESKTLINEIQSLLLTYLEHESAYKIYKQTFGFFSLGHFFLLHYVDIKEKHRLLDYGDIIQRGLALMQEGEASVWFLYNLNNRFHHILVDEAQDLNKTQWDFIQALSNEFFYNASMDDTKSVFVVGDPKQAIYSFQGSSPLLFSDVRATVTALARRYSVEVVHTELNESFRSDAIILEFVDKVFKIIRQRNTEYFVEETQHIANKKFEKSSIEIWPLVLMEKNNASKHKSNSMEWQIVKKYEEIQNAPKILANKIAVRIIDLLQEGYQPSDIMILVRKRAKLVEQLVKALKTKNIPVSGADRLVLNKNLAVQDLLSLGRFVLSSYDDYNLACLLKSPMFSVTEEELFELCKRGEYSLWENIKQQEKPTYQKIRKLLTELMENQSLQKPYKFFSYILDVLKFRTSFLATFGMHLNEILDEFLNVCLDFESKQSTSLSLFIDWFVKTKIEIKRDAYTDSNEVRIMTIHASKGLQAKVVILPDTTSVPKHHQDGILFNAALRRVMAYQYATNHIYCKTLLDETKLQILQEYYRLLYVALTRAAEKLIICGWSNNKKINPNSWYTLLEEALSIHD